MSRSSALSWTCRQCRIKTTLPSRTAPQWLQPTAHRLFSTTARKSADVETRIEVRAAPEIDFDQPSKTAQQSPARIIPVSPSYFTGSPVLNDNILLLQSLVEKYWHVPTVTPDQAPRAYWMSLAQYRSSHGERVPAGKYSKVLQLLTQLNKIHPNFLPEEVKDAMQRFVRPGAERISQAKPGKIDEYGRSIGVGRRKEASARVWLVEGTGEVLVNGHPLVQAFPRLHDRESALWPLKSTERIDKYNVFALVGGGGTTGQAESMTLALGKALLVHEPALKPALRRGKRSLFQKGICSATNSQSSWLCHVGCETCRAKEARSCQGSQEASLGQTMMEVETVFGRTGTFRLRHCPIYLYTRACTRLQISRWSGLHAAH